MNENENNLHNEENSDLNNSVDEAAENLNKNASENTECGSEASQQSSEGTGSGNSQSNNQTVGSNYTYSWNGDNFVAKKRRSGKKIAVITVACTLLISVMAFFAGAIASNLGNRDTWSEDDENSLASVFDPSEESREHSRAPQVIAPSKNNGTTSSQLNELYEKCAESCATIYVKARGGYAIGSGFVVSADGYVITNHHVIENGTDISVIFYDGKKYQAEVIGSDSLSDIAVLRIEADDLVPIELGNSSNLKVGDPVFAIGTPYNMNLAGTMTTGVISGVDRKIDVTNDYGTVTKTMTLIQTDSAINPGNSGGPLINMQGQVIGINSLKLSNYDGIGFAIPISSAIDIINELIEYGEVRDYDGDLVTATPKLNITISSVSDAREQYYIPDDAPEGCIVLALTRNSAVYRAGLELYDIITEFNGTRIENKDQLSEALNKCRAGQKVTMKLYRMNRDGSGREMEISFALDSVQ